MAINTGDYMDKGLNNQVVTNAGNIQDLTQAAELLHETVSPRVSLGLAPIPLN